VRLVPNNESELSTAQVIYNKLISANGWELVIIRSGQKTIIAQTIKVQDINSYARRDRERPKRDARVGMLPPKLAQMLINLASGPLSESSMKSICDVPIDQEVPRPNLGQTVLDPFCGTGVVLQEALLDGYNVYGSDLEPRMIEYSTTNLAWLREQYQLSELAQSLEAADATHARWHEPIDFVASEVYLGRPFTDDPTPEVLAQTTSDCNRIISLFLKNIGPKLKPGTRLCLAVPAWQIRPNTFRHLALIDQIAELGYNQVRFEHISESLIYYRSDQIVARELLVLTKISKSPGFSNSSTQY
jgi:tRNA G10  N-methylase Trm11